VGGSSVNTIVNGVMSVAAYSGTFWVGPYSAVALRIGNTSNAAAVQFYGPAATNRSMTFYSMIPTLSARWQISVTGTAESGSNAGSDFSLVRFSDTSANLGAAFTINRATGIITQSNGTVYSGGIGATTTDLTKGVSLNSSGVYGFNITAARLNYTHPGGTALHAFNGAGTDLLTIAAAGVSILTALLIPQAPKAGTAYTAAATDVVLNLAPTATFTLTLPAAASSSGRVLVLRSTAAFAVNANSSSVVPLAGGAAVAAILTAAAGKFAMLVSDGTAWQTVMAN
jgi:hypothetical protein